MKSILTFLSLFCATFLLSHSTSSAQTYKWVHGGGTGQDLSTQPYSESVYSMCTDYNGNVYTLSVLGNLPIIADTFYRPTGAFGSNQNVFFSSYDCNGQMRFGKLISGTEVTPYGLTCDMLGHVYVAFFAYHGSSTSTRLRLGYDTTITGFVNSTQTLLQYDTTGHLNWIRFVGDNTFSTYAGSLAVGSFLAVDGSNNIHFINNMQYGVHITPTITSHWGEYDLKYNAAGTLLNANKLQIDSSFVIDGVSIDPSTDNIYIVASRDISHYPDSSFHHFVAGLDLSRNIIWKDTVADPAAPGYAGFFAIVADGAGHLYLGGTGDGKIVYRGDTAYNSLSTIPYRVTTVMRTDILGNPQWRRTYSTTTSVNGIFSLTLMGNHKIAAAGLMAGKVVCGTDTITTYTGEGQNSYFTILDTAGYVHELQQIHGLGFYDKAQQIVSDRVGNLYIGGRVESTTWGGTLTPYMSVGGNTDFYVMKYGMDCDCTAMPVANYTVSGTTTKTFTYTGTTAGIDSVRWEFGDGGTSTLMNPTHTYTTGDTFTACITVYSSCGNDMHCSDFIIPCISAPTATYTTSGTGLTKTFTYTGTGIGTGSVSWTFSDGSTGTGSPVTHTFSAAATYTVCVTATNACGSNTSCSNIIVSCTSTPIANYSVGGAGLTRSFTYTGTTAGLDSVTWTFSDGGIATGLTPSHTFSAAGTYTICATVHTNCGNNTHCGNVVVTCVSSPVAAFSSAGSGLTKSFAYTGTTTGMDSVTWTFGDGGVATGISPSHTYLTAGTFLVCATVHTNCGTNTVCNNITVTCTTLPAAAFTYTITGTSGAFTYTGTTAGMDSVKWNFGDGGISTAITPTHSYTSDGTYHVCVTVYTNCGSNTICHDVVVACSMPVIASFSDTGHMMHGFAYTGTTVGLDSVVWTYGDTHRDTGIIRTHHFAVADTYHVCVTVYTDCGSNMVCRDIIITHATGVASVAMANIKVFPNPATNELYISGINQTTAYRLLSLTGVSLQQGLLKPGENNITLPPTASGIYLLEMTDSDGQKNIVRIIKQ